MAAAHDRTCDKQSSECDPNDLSIALDSQKSNLRSHSIPVGSRCSLTVLRFTLTA